MKEIRDKLTAVRLTPTEFSELKRASTLRGLSITDFFRATALAEAKRLLRDESGGSTSTNLKRTKTGFVFN